ncbi:MAG: segregation and condensation protein B [Paracoccaceae bacterium]
MSRTPSAPLDPFASLFDAPPIAEQERMIEALLFAAADPMTEADLTRRMPEGSNVKQALALLLRRYDGRGVRLEKSGGAYAFRTAADLGWLMTREAIETRPLSRAATETLAIIAYHQPATRAEIEDIRGVAVSKGTIDLLMERGWIALGRRRMTPGRPVTFVVTADFLDHFGLASTRDLPGVQELRDAGLLDNRPLPDAPGQLDEDDIPPEDGQDVLF